ncbi:MAG: signal peptidase I [Acidobacteria bacterium]|nr:signal peptidase I [Acidobacteriota bacterium]
MKKSVVREYAESLIIAVVLALFVRTFVFQAFKIPTGSMEPSLLVGDHLIVNKMIFSPSASGLERAVLPTRDVRRGDIVVFKYPEEPERDFIKRVIGMPGDRLELRSKVLYINDEALEEAWAHYASPASGETFGASLDLREAYGPVTVPEGQYFMMGDNRDNSEDSRYWGFLPASYVKGKALFIYFSFDNGLRWERLLNPVR